jgi:hypothetical protein
MAEIVFFTQKKYPTPQKNTNKILSRWKIWKNRGLFYYSSSQSTSQSRITASQSK